MPMGTDVTPPYSLIPFHNYLLAIKFEKKESVEQIMHLLFFVTVVAGLRNNMTAHVISDRLHSLGFPIETARVKDILDSKPVLFKPSVREPEIKLRESTPHKISDALRPGEIAYELTEYAKKDLARITRISWLKLQWWHNRDIIIILYVLGFMVLSVFVIGVWECTTAGASCLDFSVFKERLNLGNLTKEQKAMYFLYYITDHMKLRNDMTPDVLSERMAETGVANISANEIRSYFSSHPDEIISATRPDAYRLTETKSNEIKQLLTIKPPQLVTIGWVLDHFPLTVSVGAVVTFLGFLGSIYALGRIKGRQSALEEVEKAGVSTATK